MDNFTKGFFAGLAGLGVMFLVIGLIGIALFS